MAALLLVSLIPTPMRFAPIGPWSNLLMVAMILLIVGSALAGALNKHRPSRLMLLAWTPAFVTVSWLAFAMPRDPALTTTLQWLFPGTLVLACASLFMGLAERFASVRAERDTATLLAETDELTGALSRLALDRLLERLVARARSESKRFSVLFIDFDHFKRINDQHGHATGDRALKVAIATVFSNLRQDDRVGRYGGEEFVVTLEGVGADRAREIAERIRTDIENEGRPLHQDVPPMTVSIGVAEYDAADGEPLHSLLARADQALLTTKREGRNRVGLVAA
jgi:diguanylate cyclase (GGDEF)-like protein